MTGREIINSKLAQRRKFFILALFIVPIMLCLCTIFSKHSITNTLSVVFPISIVLCYAILLFYRVFSVSCPFCKENLPLNYNEWHCRILSDDYKYCPYCCSGFNEQVNEKTLTCNSDDMQKLDTNEQEEKKHLTGRDLINAKISKTKNISFLISIVVIIFLGYLFINKIYSIWMMCLGVCFVITLLVKALSWSVCPFCDKKLCLSITEDSKWKLERKYLFCHNCGVSIDQQLHE